MKLLSKDVARYKEHWQEEIDSAAQYRALAVRESDQNIARIYRNLAKVEENHIKFWEEHLRKAGVNPGPRKPSWRSRVLMLIAKWVGAEAVLPTIAANEHVGRNNYAVEHESQKTPMAGQERTHSRVLQQVLATSRGGVRGGFLGQLEGRHRAVGGNVLRAAVLGANDGLCSNLSLVMGVAGAAANSHSILLTGLAGLLAGAFSMALGEWISVASSRELASREIRIEAEELEADPQAEAAELRLIYEAKGLSETEARSMVDHLLADKTAALDTLSREELGIDPNEMGGSPFGAAITSFLLFALGAIIPVAPFFFIRGQAAVLVSLSASALALFTIGALITIFTGRPVWRSGGRQLLFGLVAAGATFAVGRAIGVAIGGS